MMAYTIVNRNWVNNRRLNITAKNLICFFKENFSKTTGRIQANQGSGNRNSNNNNNEKIIYNTVIKDFKMLFEHETVQPSLPEKPPVVSLKYFSNYFNEKSATLSLSEDTAVKSTKDENKSINLPYKRHDNVTLQNVSEESSENDNKNDVNQQTADLVFNSVKDKSRKKISKKWMQNYDKYSEISVNLHDDESEDEAIDVIKDAKYGSADPKVPSSSVPCGGCGAHLHCQDFAIPGFLPKEIFIGLSSEQLQALVCQRCHFLQEYDTALSVSVDPQMYPKLLSKIKGQTALVILVVDMTDFPCSIWPGILDLVGPKRPLVVVGNKMDLLQDWSRKCLIRAKESLIKHLPSGANILHVELISAKTGFGIESLVTKLYNLWEYRGDVYLVGCTNVGKSTLFNALLQSDYCKTKAVDLMQRATISPWPGTTLNLLKFPIMRPEGWRLASRTLRLREQRSKDLEKLRQGITESTPQMISCIERTFTHGITNKYNDDYWDDPFAMPKMSTLRSLRPSGSGLDPNDAVFAQSKWLYDTPGVITPDQIIDLLTTEELMLTLPREPIVPRTFQVWPGQTLFLAGLGRVDYIDGPNNIKMTVLSAPTLPVTLCWLADASYVYEQYLGSDAFAVPCGGESRLQMWPGLEPAPEVTLKGIGWRESCADVVLSSAGWVAVTNKEDSLIRLQAWTPNARGVHIRIPPVLPRAVAVKGIKMHRTQAYSLFNENIKAMLR